MNWSKTKVLEAINVGSRVLGYVLEVAPTGPVGRVMSVVLKEVVPRALSWFSMSPKQINNDALFKAMRQPLKSRILLDVERAKRQADGG